MVGPVGELASYILGQKLADRVERVALLAHQEAGALTVDSHIGVVARPDPEADAGLKTHLLDQLGNVVACCLAAGVFSRIPHPGEDLDGVGARHGAVLVAEVLRVQLVQDLGEWDAKFGGGEGEGFTQGGTLGGDGRLFRHALLRYVQVRA